MIKMIEKRISILKNLFFSLFSVRVSVGSEKKRHSPILAQMPTTQLILILLSVYYTSSTLINPSDSRFLYEGRWLHSTDSSEADWPCASVRFAINVTKETNETIDLRWEGIRSRMNISVSEGILDFSHIYRSDVVHGSSVEIPFQKPSTYSLSLENIPLGIHTVRFRKLTTSCPYGSGIGDDLLSSSHVKFYGVELPSSIIMPPPPPLPLRRKIEFIGASDTAGYCVDGEPSFNVIQYGLEGWKYENCDLANTGNLGQMFQADISIPSISGIGLTQNANAKHSWIMGKETARDYWNFTLQSSSKHLWDFSTWRPDLVYVSLGGNDYNHQNGHVPSNETFTEAYERFMLRVLNTYVAKISPSHLTQLTFIKTSGTETPRPKFSVCVGRAHPLKRHRIQITIVVVLVLMLKVQ